MFDTTNIAESPLALTNVKAQAQENALAKSHSSSHKTASTFNSSTGSPLTDDVQEAGLFDFCNLLEYAPMPEIQQLESIYDKSETMLKQSKKIQKEKPQNSKNKESKPSKVSEKKKTVSAKKDAWRADEDEQLIELHAKHGQKWAKIASLMENRTGKQVRDRYLNMLRPDINHEDWTPEEEELFDTLIEQYPNKWCKIASLLPGRTENQVKNKFYWERRKKSPTPVKKSKRNIPRKSMPLSESESSETQQSADVEFALIDEASDETILDQPINDFFQYEPSYEPIPDPVESSSCVEPIENFFQFVPAPLFDCSSSDEILEDNFRELNWTAYNLL